MNLGVIIDTNLKLGQYISNTGKSAYFHIKSSLSSYKDAAIICHVFITNKIDFRNSLLYSMPDNVINRLQ